MKLGYSHHGMFRFPRDPKQCAEAARVLGIPAAERQKIVDHPSRYHIGPWHYHSRHRKRDKTGRWRLRKEKSYRDSDGKI
jgi:hypothetical protein